MGSVDGRAQQRRAQQHPDDERFWDREPDGPGFWAAMAITVTLVSAAVTVMVGVAVFGRWAGAW